MIILQENIKIIFEILYYKNIQNIIILELIHIDFLKSFSIDTSNLMYIKHLSLNINLYRKQKIALEILNLEGCKNLKDITNLLPNIQSLKKVYMNKCTNLINGGKNIHPLSSIITIDL